MPLRFIILLLLVSLSPCLRVFSQTEAVIKTKSTNALTESIVIKSGTSITVNAGASIINNGTATGFGSGGTWGSITGTLSAQTDLQSALDAKLASATAATTYQPLDSDLTAIAALTTTSIGRSLLAGADAAALRSILSLGSLATLSEVGAAQITNGSILGEDINASANIALGALGSITFETTGVIINSTGIVTEGFIEAATFDGNGAAITALNASNLTTGTVAAARMPALTGDITTSSGAVATTLATVNSNVGSFTNASITVNAKGLVTAASSGTAGVGGSTGSTDNAILRADGTGGSTVQATLATMTDAGAPTFYDAVTVRKTGGSATDSVIETFDDPLNPSLLPTYILPPQSGGRVYFGKSGRTVGNINFAFVGGVENFPSIVTVSPYNIATYVGDVSLIAYNAGIRLETAAGGLVKFNGSTSSFPALKRSGTVIQARLADDSAAATLQGKLILESAAAPSGSGDTGTAGEVRYDASYLYICTATNTWTRIALAW